MNRSNKTNNSRRKKSRLEPKGEKTIIILTFDGHDARRFAAYMTREHIAAKAPAAKKLILDRLDQLNVLPAAA